MAIEAERITSSRFFPPWIVHEHQARYEFASGFCRGKVVIDCACGEGKYADVLATEASALHGFDVSQGAVDNARRYNSAPMLTSR
jgi:2-polyprenyl-3-methyl-5-hydroxy-6-metoxy-1,4-benzoquinol methylase